MVVRAYDNFLKNIEIVHFFAKIKKVNFSNMGPMGKMRPSAIFVTPVPPIFFDQTRMVDWY